MNLGLVLLIGLVGAAGAVCRFFIDSAIKTVCPTGSWRVGTIVVNAVGSFLLGFFTALWCDGGALLSHSASASPHLDNEQGNTAATLHISSPAPQRQWLAIAGTGFCGGLTTFSTASLDTVELTAQRGPVRAISYSAIVLAASFISALLGLVAGALFRHYA